jgi:WD40 repeat protein
MTVGVLFSCGSVDVALASEKPKTTDAPPEPPPVRTVDCLRTARWKNPWDWSSQGGLHITSDSKILATGGTKKGIGLWDVASGKKIADWVAKREIGDFSWQIKVCPDVGVLVATGGKDARVIQVCEVKNGKIRKTWQAPEYLLKVELSADAKLVATVSNQGTVHVWDTFTGEERGKFLDAWAAVFTSDAKTLVIASTKFKTWDKISVWDVATCKELRVLEGTATSLALSTDGKILAGAGKDGIHLWDLATNRLMRTIPANMGGFFMSTVCVSGDGRTVALKNDSMIAAWDVATGKLLFQMPDNWWYQPFALSPDGRSFTFSDGSNVECRDLSRSR